MLAEHENSLSYAVAWNSNKKDIKITNVSDSGVWKIPAIRIPLSHPNFKSLKFKDESMHRSMAYEGDKNIRKWIGIDVFSGEKPRAYIVNYAMEHNLKYTNIT